MPAGGGPVGPHPEVDLEGEGDGEEVLQHRPDPVVLRAWEKVKLPISEIDVPLFFLRVEKANPRGPRWLGRREP